MFKLGFFFCLLVGIVRLGVSETCLQPPAIEHGSFNVSKVPLAGARANYTCDKGYKFKTDTNSVICLDTGKWSTPVPACVATECPSTPTIDHGYFNETDTDIGTQVEYTCIDGYSFENVSTEKCLETAQWSLPRPVCLPPDCYPIATIDNGHPIGSPNDTVYGSIVTYNCDEGYQLTDTNQTECLITGYWSVLPECVKIRTDCGPFPIVSHANITEADVNTTVGALVQYACETGYDLIGNETAECLSTLNWSAIPNCELACDDPPDIDGGYIDGPISTHNGDSVKYNCSNGFDMVSTDTILCQNGTWGQLPVCIAHCNDSDIVFLVDGSGSVGDDGFNHTKNFLISMVRNYPISTTHFGLATFSNIVFPVFNLNTSTTNKNQLIEAIKNTTYPSGSTHTRLALQYARTDMLQTKNGRRPDAIPAVVIVTDGEAIDKVETLRQAQLLKNAGVSIYSIGVGAETDLNELQNIATKNEYVFSVGRYSNITQVAGPLSEALCNVQV